MRFTDIFIKRPVLSTVVSLFIFVVGLAGIFSMQVSEYPKMENTTITISTAYPGASADVIQGFITNVIAASVGTADGIDYMTSSSVLGSSTITVYVKLNYNPDDALTEITGKVNAVLYQLPKAAFSPTITKQTGNTMPDLILGFTSKSLTQEQISAYLQTVITPSINALGNISQILIWGQQQYAMRIWLDSKKMAALGITSNDVNNALQANNIQSTAGDLKSSYLYTDINLKTDLHDAEQFNNLVVKNVNGNLIRIKDIGHAELGSQNYDSQVKYNNQSAAFLAIFSATEANPLTVVTNVLKLMPTLEKAYPPGLTSFVVYNTTDYIRASIHEVIDTIIEATLIVIVVIFLFLGALRSVFIPVITIPLSLVGVCFLMLAMHFSLNLLTLLAMVLAIGLVVDDAIVVLENIYRHLEEGLSPFQAAIKGAREITGPVIVMTCTLAAVFAPIGFTSGITGALFKQFAFTLAGAVIISGVIALTFSPMLCSRIIDHKVMEGKLVKAIDRSFEKIKNFYHACLTAALNYRPAILIMGATVLASCAFLFVGTKAELAPMEDQSFIFVQGQGPSAANLGYLYQFNPQVQAIFDQVSGALGSFQVDGYPSDNVVFGGIVLKPWSDRKETQMQLTPQVQNAVNAVPGLQMFAAGLPPLPGTPAGPPISFVITSTSPYSQLDQMSQYVVSTAMKSGMFMYVSSDLRFDRPLLTIDVNRDKAASLGIDMNTINSMLTNVTGGPLINYFSKGGYAFQVIQQLPDDLRTFQQQLDQIYLPTKTQGQQIPLSSLVSMKIQTEPQSLNQFNQLNSFTISAIPMPSVTQGQALNYFNNLAENNLPSDIHINYAAQSRQFVQEGNSLVTAFFFALIVIFLVLSAQFESFRDPFIILVAVPMSICGALIPLYLGAATMNIYTEIGLITLIGLISKHGILMVEFANKLQEHEGLSIREAIIKAASIRLRPILMTTAAMVFGVVPLIFASGAGAVSRFDVGLVIATGMLIGTCFTLFVVPTIYTFLAADRVSELKRKAEIQVMPPETDEHHS